MPYAGNIVGPKARILGDPVNDELPMRGPYMKGIQIQTHIKAMEAILTQKNH